MTFDAVDFNPFLIAKAKEKHNRENINYKYCFFDADYPTKDYDIIITRFVLEHVKRMDDFLYAVHEKLKTNGYFVIIEYYIDIMHSTEEPWREFRDKEILLYKEVGSNPYTSINLPLGLQRAGFKSIESVFNHISPVTVGRC